MTKSRAGHVYQPPGRAWAFILDVAPEGAPRKQVKKGGFKTKADALRAMHELQASLANGTHVEASKVTLAEFIRAEWLPAVEGAGKRATTLRSYRMHLDAHVAPHIGSMRLQAVTGADLNRFYGVLLREGRSDGTGGLAPASVRRCHAMLHRVFADAIRWGRLSRNPCDSADPPKQHGAGESEMETWTAVELRRFLDSVRDDRLHALWLLLASTGLRRGEAIGLRWEDVDLEAGRASITQTLVAVGYDVQVSTPKTRRGRRLVSIDPGTVAALRSWRSRQLEDRLAWGPAWTDSGLVFTREDGSMIHPDRVSKMFNAHVKQSGLPRIRLHDLRHTHASIALAAGINPKVVSERLGHATASFTLDVYSHAIPGLQDDAAAKVAALVFG